MKFGQFVVAFALALNSIPGFAAQVGPELTHADLEALASNQNLVKGDLILWPTDQTALTNIKLALHYMTYPHPIFVATEAPSEYRYQVNADEDLKIKEVSLEGVKLNQVSVFFKNTGAARWDFDSGIHVILPPEKVKNPSYRSWDNTTSEFKYVKQETPDGNMWEFPVTNEDGTLREGLKLNGDSTFYFHATSAKGFGRTEDECWWYNAVKFNLTQTAIQKHLTQEGRVVFFIQGELAGSAKHTPNNTKYARGYEYLP